MKKVLTIAGSDSGGGAGIQADLKTFAARGVYGMSVITALTAQNTLGVQGIFEVDPLFVKKQIDSVMSDIGADVWKTGMLSNAKIIKVVAECAQEYGMEFIVVDPVMVAKGGDKLLKSEAEQTLARELIPLSYVVTPNIPEAQVLAKIKINNTNQAQEAAIKIHNMGAKNIVIKGGHLTDVKESIDILYDGINFIKFHAQRIKTVNTHGTGCTFASAIAAELAKGYAVKQAVHVAKSYLTAAIQKANELNIGNGHGPTDHSQGYIVDVDLNLVKIK